MLVKKKPYFVYKIREIVKKSRITGFIFTLLLPQLFISGDFFITKKNVGCFFLLLKVCLYKLYKKLKLCKSSTILIRTKQTFQTYLAS